MLSRVDLHMAIYNSTKDIFVHHTRITHLSLDKMAAILADDNFKCIFLNKNDTIPIRFSLEF